MHVEHKSELTFGRAMKLLRRRGPAVALCVLIAVGGALALSLASQRKYTATAALVFNTTPMSQQIAGLPAVVNTSAQATQDTNVQLLELGDLPRKTAASVGAGLTPAAVKSSVTIAPQGDTTVVSVSATTPSPSLSAKVANAYVNAFVNEQETANHRYYASALSTVEGQLAKLSASQKVGPQGLALEDRAQSLATLSQLKSGTVTVAQQAAVPRAPSSPKTAKNIAVALVLGLLIGCVLALGLERLDQRIREPEELERLYDLPLLGVVPESRSLRHGSGADIATDAAADAFQFIRAHLRYFNVDRDIRTLAVVSDAPGDGKTTISYRLAHAVSTMGARVLLLEADLRRPTLAQQGALRPGPGLADIVIGASSLEDAVQTLAVGPAARSSERGGRSLDVLVAGPPPPNPAEMLESHALDAVLEEARATYQFVIIDTAPLGAVSDAFPLLQKVDGVVVVASVGRDRRDSARRLGEALRTAGAPLLGVIANRVKALATSGYGYGYGYSYDPAYAYPPDEAPRTRRGGAANGSTPDGVPESRTKA